jgi:Domain of unknown function (DUF4259)
MGAWGIGPFENDDAQDFASELESDGASAIRAALEAVALLEPEAYLEAPASSRAIAAAEVLAATRGRPAPDLPPEITDWVSSAPHVDESLVPPAVVAMTRILEESELKELWESSTDGPEWERRVADLRERLRIGL